MNVLDAPPGEPKDDILSMYGERDGGGCSGFALLCYVLTMLGTKVSRLLRLGYSGS